MPFILRGACLLGIDSGYIGEPYRNGVWQRLAERPAAAAPAGDGAHHRLSTIYRGVFDDYLRGHAHGRVVVAIAGA
jgi:acrylyl-CoA reductase (NADPH)